MSTFLTAEEVLTIAEAKADSASTAYQRKTAASIGGLYISDLADFRHAVRYAATGAVLHVAGCMAQTDHYTCVGELSDGTRLYQCQAGAAISADEWSQIVD